MMDKLYDMAMESVLVRGIIGLMFTVTICYMYGAGMEVPESLVGLLGIILGAFFQASANQAAERRRLELGK